jgi:hypothetical protein
LPGSSHVWLAHPAAFISNRATAAQAGDHILRAVQLLLFGNGTNNCRDRYIE